MRTELREECQHRWVDIYKTFGMSDLFVSKRHGPCPLCGGTDRGRMTDFQGYGSYICNQCCSDSIDGIELLRRLTGKSFKVLSDEIRSILVNTKANAAPPKDIKKAKAQLRKVWSDAKPLYKGCVTHRYLIGRGLAGLDFGSLQSIRCHPGIVYWHQEDGELMNLGAHPCMVGLVTDPSGQPATIHCTYLGKDGRKGAFDKPKKIMTPSRDYTAGAVRLQNLGKDEILCVAEGIETALAMKLLFPDIVPWACLNAGNMTKFQPPSDCSGASMYIGADNDISHTGQAAAYQLAKRLSGKHKVEVLLPKKQGNDFLDEYNEQRQATT